MTGSLVSVQMGGSAPALDFKASAFQGDFKASAFAPLRQTQMNRFSGMVMLLGCIYLALLLGLSEYTTYADDPVSPCLLQTESARVIGIRK